MNLYVIQASITWWVVARTAHEAVAVWAVSLLNRGTGLVRYELRTYSIRRIEKGKVPVEVYDLDTREPWNMWDHFRLATKPCVISFGLEWRDIPGRGG